MWKDPQHIYFARQNRMIERAMQRKESEPQGNMDKLNELMKTEGLVAALDYAQPYREYMMEAAFKQYTAIWILKFEMESIKEFAV